MPSNSLNVPPEKPKLYHIVHIGNLESIVSSGFLYSDASRIEMRLNNVNIGMSTIKERRLHRCRVNCYPDTTVGQYFPFYFCPRSVMLFIIHTRNHPELSYRGGQEPIVHLQMDMQEVIEWADASGTRWAFSDRNASDKLASFYNDTQDLDQINWAAVASRDFSRQSGMKEPKQAEFLVYDRILWSLVEKIGVINAGYKRRVTEIVQRSEQRPEISIERSWYYY